MGKVPSIRIWMLGFWLFAITAPNIITFLDVDKPVIIINTNEEEQQELEKNAQPEEKITHNNTTNLQFLSHLENTSITDFCLHGQAEHIIEIPFPPPEYDSV